VSILNQNGIQKIAIDPGIGFGKRVEDNLHILKDLHVFSKMQLPLLIGLSRKSFIGHVLDLEVSGRENASISANVIARMNGADILRVHDVAGTRQAVMMAEAIIYS
jgi:dihydropteroate synthase